MALAWGASHHRTGLTLERLNNSSHVYIHNSTYTRLHPSAYETHYMLVSYGLTQNHTIPLRIRHTLSLESTTYVLTFHMGFEDYLVQR